MKNNQNGRSMVEMLGVLAIIGVLSAGGLAGYSKAMFKHKLNNTMDQITMLVTNIRTMYGTQDNYSNISGTIDKLGIIPAAMGSSYSKLVNPFKGTVTILPSNATGNDETTATAFVVTYNGLPKEACIALATADWGAGAGSGFLGAKIGSDSARTVASIITGSGEGYVYPIGTAAETCANTTDSVSLKFY